MCNSSTGAKEELPDVREIADPSGHTASPDHIVVVVKNAATKAATVPRSRPRNQHVVGVDRATDVRGVSRGYRGGKNEPDRPVRFNLKIIKRKITLRSAT